MDMEAGLEHLGRATASAVDKLIVVVEPGRRSIDTAEHIRRLASEIHLKQLFIVGNKVRSEKDEAFLRQHLADFDILGFLPYADDLIEADLNGASPYDVESTAKARVKEMVDSL
jgi:CO dehydrogenase maturation factor